MGRGAGGEPAGATPDAWDVASLLADPDRCYRAVVSRDRRFDGRIVLAVSSTGIYCRPSCPTAVRPKRSNAHFYPTAAAAQGAGFRACKRCRPDAAPGSPEWFVGDELVDRAMRAIAAGEVDRAGVEGLAAQLGVSARHLDRVLKKRVGAGPLALARARRSHAARQLLEHTTLPVSEVAFAAGFGSIRQFNDTMQAVYNRTPTRIREAVSPDRFGPPRGRRSVDPAPRDPIRRNGRLVGPSAPAPVNVQVAIRPPFDAAEVLGFLASRALPGVEWGDGGQFSRMLSLPGGPAAVTLRPTYDHDGMTVEVLATDLGDLTAAVAVAERLTDATCDPAVVVDLLGVDPALAEAVRAHPGRRMPACADGFEALVRAVLGQQVALGQGVALAASLVEVAGRPAPEWAPPGLTRLPLEPADVVDADLTELGMPAKRRDALHAAAAAVASGRVSLAAHANRAEIRRALLDVPGIGPWTADYVALRGLADPDAFPAGDVALQRGARALGLDASPEALLRRAERWRPWRAIAAAHLWANAAVPSAPGLSLTDDATQSHVTTRST